MLLVIASVLTPVEAAVLREAAGDLSFDDGRKTAGRFAAAVKANDQAAPSPELEAILAKVERALAANALFRSCLLYTSRCV